MALNKYGTTALSALLVTAVGFSAVPTAHAAPTPEAVAVQVADDHNATGDNTNENTGHVTETHNEKTAVQELPTPVLDHKNGGFSLDLEQDVLDKAAETKLDASLVADLFKQGDGMGAFHGVGDDKKVSVLEDLYVYNIADVDNTMKDNVTTLKETTVDPDTDVVTKNKIDSFTLLGAYTPDGRDVTKMFTVDSKTGTITLKETQLPSDMVPAHLSVTVGAHVKGDDDTVYVDNVEFTPIIDKDMQRKPDGTPMDKNPKKNNLIADILGLLGLGGAGSSAVQSNFSKAQEQALKDAGLWEIYKERQKEKKSSNRSNDLKKALEDLQKLSDKTKAEKETKDTKDKADKVTNTTVANKEEEAKSTTVTDKDMKTVDDTHKDMKKEDMKKEDVKKVETAPAPVSNVKTGGVAENPAGLLGMVLGAMLALAGVAGAVFVGRKAKQK